jgi:hypothetical protein
VVEALKDGGPVRGEPLQWLEMYYSVLMASGLRDPLEGTRVGEDDARIPPVVGRRRLT